MSIVKKQTIVDESIYSDGTSDSFRKLAKANWHNNVAEDSQVARLLFGGKESNTLNNSLIGDIEIGDITINSDVLFYEFTTPVRISGDQSRIAKDSEWYELITENIEDGTYQDHAFSIDIPYTSKEAEYINTTSHTTIGDIDLYYNYFQKQYEGRIAALDIPEPVLPNLYAFVSTMNPDIASARAFKDLITLNGKLSESFIYALNDSGEKTSFYDRGGYLHNYGISVGQALDVLETKFSHILVSHDQVDYLHTAAQYKDFFPMYCNVSLQTDTNTQFADMLEGSGIGANFMKDMLNSLFGLQSASEMTVNEGSFVEHHQSPMISADDEGNIFYEQNEVISTNTRRYIGIEDWWTSTYGTETSPLGAAGIFIGNLSTEVMAASSNEFEFYKNFIYIMMAGLLRPLISSEIRTFDQILKGDLAYSETLMYRISKFSGTVDENTTAEPIQSFWLPNSSKIDVVNFIDTQVKYGEEYTYIVYAYQCVLGVEYSYSDLAISNTVSLAPQVCVELIDPSSGEMVESLFADGQMLQKNANYGGIYEASVGNRYTAEFNVTYKPSLQMFEVPLMVTTKKMIDNPPLSPELDFIPYIGVNNRIRLFMSGRTGEEQHQEVSFNDEDRAVFADIRTAQGIESYEQITFRNDDYPYQYEVYKIKTKPTSYEDFGDALIARIDTAISDLSYTTHATAVAYEDKVLPNTKYYYIFRSVDIHGNISHPSPIFEFEMVDDGTSVYPVVEMVEIDQPVVRTPFKTGRRMIHILPNIRHRLINEEASGFEDAESAKELGGNVIVGDADSPVWDNKFKIRLTSRKTGRKIDLNLQFSTKHIVTDIEKN
jgi:hypothetical protein